MRRTTGVIQDTVAKEDDATSANKTNLTAREQERQSSDNRFATLGQQLVSGDMVWGSSSLR